MKKHGSENRDKRERIPAFKRGNNIGRPHREIGKHDWRAEDIELAIPQINRAVQRYECVCDNWRGPVELIVTQRDHPARSLSEYSNVYYGRYAEGNNRVPNSALEPGNACSNRTASSYRSATSGD